MQIDVCKIHYVAFTRKEPCRFCKEDKKTLQRTMRALAIKNKKRKVDEPIMKKCKNCKKIFNAFKRYPYRTFVILKYCSAECLKDFQREETRRVMKNAGLKIKEKPMVNKELHLKDLSIGDKVIVERSELGTKEEGRIIALEDTTIPVRVEFKGRGASWFELDKIKLK